MTWEDLAACIGHDPDMFFPDDGDHATRDAALAICAVCPVRNACLEHALTTGELYGIWGGTTARQRTRIRRTRDRTAHTA